MKKIILSLAIMSCLSFSSIESPKNHFDQVIIVNEVKSHVGSIYFNNSIPYSITIFVIYNDGLKCDFTARGCSFDEAYANAVLKAKKCRNVLFSVRNFAAHGIDGWCT